MRSNEMKSRVEMDRSMMLPISKPRSIALLTAHPPMPNTIVYMQKLRNRSTWATFFRSILNASEFLQHYYLWSSYNERFGFFTCNVVKIMLCFHNRKRKFGTFFLPWPGTFYSKFVTHSLNSFTFTSKRRSNTNEILICKIQESLQNQAQFNENLS